MDHSIVSDRAGPENSVSPNGETVSIQECRDTLPIPVDLVIEIFSRLPAKSVARNRRLSKFWANVIRSQHFMDLFIAKHAAQQILFAHKNEAGFSFFSAHQSLENASGNIEPTYLSHFPISSEYYGLGVPINGLVCISEDKDEILVPVIFNPNTQESLTLPEMNIWSYCPNATHFLGYDPSENQFKVLSCYYTEYYEGYAHRIYADHRVLTLETGQLSWRRTRDYGRDYVPISRSEICINGVLYYRAYGRLDVQLIVCFDVKSETFRFINVMETFNKSLPVGAILTNYEGKLGLLVPETSLLNGESVSFELWVLKDSEWSNHVYVLPPDWKNLVGETELFFVGMTPTNEFVFSSSSSPYIFYYNIKENAIRKLSIQGMKASRLESFRYMRPSSLKRGMFLNHVENVSLYIN